MISLYYLADINASQISAALSGYARIDTRTGEFVSLFESALVKQDLDTDSDTELNAVGAIFAPSAFGHSMRGGITVEEQRQAAARATDLVVTAVAGAAIIQDTHACKLVGSATD